MSDIETSDKDYSKITNKTFKAISIGFVLIQGSVQPENQECQMYHFQDKVFVLFEVNIENLEKLHPLDF